MLQLSPLWDLPIASYFHEIQDSNHAGHILTIANSLIQSVRKT